MAQSRKTYGRRTLPNANTKSFMDELRLSAEQRERSFGGEQEGAVINPKRPHGAPFRLTSEIEQQPTAKKRHCAFESEDMPPPKKPLQWRPSPEECVDDFGSSPSSSTPRTSKQAPVTKSRISFSPSFPPFQTRFLSPPGSLMESPVPSAIDGGSPSSFSAENGGCHEAPLQHSTEDSNLVPIAACPQACTSLSIDAGGRSIERMTEEQLEIILGYVLPIRMKSYYRPYYRKGMMYNGVRSGLKEDDGIAMNENVDLSVFRVCRGFYTVGARLFYGKSCFKFANPDVCRWWLKRIGPQNIARVKDLSLRIGTDWIISRAKGHHFGSELDALRQMDRSAHEDKCCEETWALVFAQHIQPNHRLEKLHMELDGWRSTQPRSKWAPKEHVMTLQVDRDALEYWRGLLLDFLDKHMRGIRKPKIACINDYGEGLTEKQRDGLEMTMTRPRHTATPRNPLKRVSLESALQQAARIRRKKEAERL